jgi:hypothetical protein
VPQFTHGRGQATTNLSQTLGLSELTEEHSHEMIPGVESLAVPLSTMFPDQMVELTFVEQSNQLTEKARTTYHVPVLLVFLRFSFVGAKKISHEEDTFSISFPQTVFGQE